MISSVDLRWEPGAGNPHAGFCPGGGPKGPSLPGCAPVKTGGRKQVRKEEMEAQVLTKQVLPWEGAPPQETESCVGGGNLIDTDEA